MQSFNLYEIASAIPALIESNEFSDDNKEEILEELNLLLKNKSDNIIGYTKNMEITIEAMKNEEERIRTQRKRLENNLDKYKNYVKYCMQANNIPDIQTRLGRISLAKAPVSVEIIDEEKVPNKYKKIKMETTISKKAIVDDFKSTGEIVDGVNLITNKVCLRIK